MIRNGRLLLWSLIVFMIFLKANFLLLGQSENDLLGSWVRVRTMSPNELVSDNIEIIADEYLKLRFNGNNELTIFGHYQASGVGTKYALKNNFLIFGFDRKFRVEFVDKSRLILVELDKGRVTDNSVKHIYLRESVFLAKLPLSYEDIFLHDRDTVYFASKKLYPEFQARIYPDFHLYVHNQVKPSYSYGSNHIYATFIVYPDGSVGEVDILHHVNKASDKKALRAIINSKNRWSVPFLESKEVPVLMHVEDRYVSNKKNGRNEVSFEINQQELTDQTSLYSANLYQIALALRKGEYERALEYIGTCEKILPKEPNLIYLKFRCYSGLGNTVLLEKAKLALKKTRLRYLIN